MSLTSFLASNSDVRERFKLEFIKPKFLVKKDLVAPPLTKNPTLVGIAFDYLLRFYVKHLNPSAITGSWIAEKAGAPSKEALEKFQSVILNAYKLYSNYVSTGEMTEKIIISTLRLAMLDLVYRSKNMNIDFNAISKEDIDELKALISILNPNLFKTEKTCLLNPEFGEASRIIKGADADLFIDGTLIEIKTIKKLHFPVDYFNQLMGYYVLNEISGIGDIKPKLEISKIAVYYSRYAYLHIVDLKKIINRETFPDFICWFKERIK